MLTLIWGIDILFEKLASQIETWFWKNPLHIMPHANSVFFFNIFSGDSYFDDLIIGLFSICLVKSQALRECTH